MEIITTLFTPESALFSTINFLIAFGVLKYFVFDRISEALGQRQLLIEQSAEHAEALEVQLTNAEKEAADIVAKATLEANAFTVAQKKQAEDMIAQMKHEAEEEIARARRQAESQLEVERSKMEKDLKQMTADLAVQATAKIIDKKFDQKDDRELIVSYLNQLDHAAEQSKK